MWIFSLVSWSTGSSVEAEQEEEEERVTSLWTEEDTACTLVAVFWLNVSLVSSCGAGASLFTLYNFTLPPGAKNRRQHNHKLVKVNAATTITKMFVLWEKKPGPSLLLA